MKKTFFPILALILVACASLPEGSSAPQVTPPSPALGEGPGVRETSTPPPTETPLPTLTPTPVAVDGIAEDAEGDKLAYLNGEWMTLPPLDGEFARMLQQPDGNVVALDADGEVAYEYDMATGSWVEVVQYPDWVRELASAGNTLDLERGLVYDADGRVLGATGANGEWISYPNGMVPLAAQDGSGEPPFEVRYAAGFEEAIAWVTDRLPWNNPTVYAKAPAERAARITTQYERYLAQVFTGTENWSPEVISVRVQLAASNNPNYYVEVFFYDALLPDGREVTSMSYRSPATGLIPERIFIDVEANVLVEELQSGDHEYKIVGP